MPVLCEGSVLVDGGLVKPVPVSLARAMGADILIAVDLGSDILGRHLRADSPPEAPAGAVGDWIRKLHDNLGALIPAHPPDQPRMPSMLDVLVSSINNMQVWIAHSRLGRAARPDRGAAVGPPSAARLSPGKGSDRRRLSLGGTCRAQSCCIQQSSIVNAMMPNCRRPSSSSRQCWPWSRSATPCSTVRARGNWKSISERYVVDGHGPVVE